jgi:hypothetical protein
MPSDTKLDPFKPLQPAIPGVPPEDPNRKKTAPPPPKPPAPLAAAAPLPVMRPAQPDESKSQRMAIGICLTACLLLAGMGIAWKLFTQAQPVVAPAEVHTQNAAAELDGPPKPPANVPIGPGVIATTDDLAKPWSSRPFRFREQITGELLPAMVVRLPNGSFWGFSMKEPFGSCDLEYVTDLEKLQTTYDFRSDHPMVGDPCQHAVFDLLLYGGPPSAEVRGALVHGMGVRPPLAIEIEQHGKEVRAIKME